EKGPKKCSGLNITQYSQTSLAALLGKDFKMIKWLTVDHKTPFDTVQDFLFCGFIALA
ncbi:MAG: SAM-dependent methyltransferase, partial [bacterium]|nr:SAM-dependent methyltransferase [bacterium]